MSHCNFWQSSTHFSVVSIDDIKDVFACQPRDIVTAIKKIEENVSTSKFYSWTNNNESIENANQNNDNHYMTSGCFHCYQMMVDNPVYQSQMLSTWKIENVMNKNIIFRK